MGDSYDDNGELAPLSPCAEPPPAPTGKWYVEYYSEDDFHCVKDCKVRLFSVFIRLLYPDLAPHIDFESVPSI